MITGMQLMALAEVNAHERNLSAFSYGPGAKRIYLMAAPNAFDRTLKYHAENITDWARDAKGNECGILATFNGVPAYLSASPEDDPANPGMSRYVLSTVGFLLHLLDIEVSEVNSVQEMNSIYYPFVRVNSKSNLWDIAQVLRKKTVYLSGVTGVYHDVPIKFGV